MDLRARWQGFAPQLAAAVPVWMLQLAILAVFLTVADQLELTAAETTGWIFAMFAVSGLLGIITSFVWKQPIAWTPHLLAVILFGSLAGEATFPELVGAAMVAGAVVVLLAVTGVTRRMASIIPPAVIMGLIAGVVAPLVWQLFTAFGTAPVIVGSILLGYAVSLRTLGTRIPPIFSALLAGALATGITGRFGDPLPAPSLPEPVFIMPTFSLDIILATVPILIVLMTLQTNVGWVVYLQSQGYRPPEQAINVAGGATTILGALLGPMALSTAIGAAPILAGPDAGEMQKRHRSVYALAAFSLLIAAGASLAVPISLFFPVEFILSLAGLALLNVLVASLTDVVSGPLKLGPVVAFAVALSDISLLGLGPFFWSLVFGTATSYVLERDGWRQMRALAGTTAIAGGAGASEEE